MYMNMSVYIYIYIYAEREEEREMNTTGWNSMCFCFTCSIYGRSEGLKSQTLCYGMLCYAMFVLQASMHYPHPPIPYDVHASWKICVSLCSDPRLPVNYVPPTPNPL